MQISVGTRVVIRLLRTSRVNLRDGTIGIFRCQRIGFNVTLREV